jgi:uncharacterized protein
MSQLSRRQFLIFFGGSTAATALSPNLSFLGGSDAAEAAAAAKPLSFTPVRLPHPLPVYQQQQSFLPAGGGQGTIVGAADTAAKMNLASYTPLDDVIVPPEFERYSIVSWGDRIFPNPDEYFGYNCDYTGYVPLPGLNNAGLLWVNHEYVSFPISRLAPETPSDLTAAFPESGPLVIPGFPTTQGRELLGEFLYNMGGSIVLITRKNNRDKFVVKKDVLNRRIHALSGLGINSQRSDAYQTVTAWGSKSYQKGDNNYLTSTGPAALEVFEAVNSDGLGSKIIGTGYNCSGGTTPWGTILTAEENFQGSSIFFVGVTESVKPDGTQTGYTDGTTGKEFGLVGEKYGWMVEISPANPNYRPRKHTWLGRFRHENIAFRADAGKRLVCYLGDDRRSGHTWKYVSTKAVTYPTDPNNSGLFEDGILYVARFNPPADPTRPNAGTGEWIPLLLNTPTNPIPPSVLSATEFAALGAAQRNGLLRLPRRAGIAGQTTSGGSFSCDRTNEATTLSAYQNKRLSDFYPTQGAALVDAYLAANVIGGTPSARPEDIEIHPRTKEVFIAYTDGAPGSDGYADSRIFVVAKYSTAANAAQQSGGIYKIIENSGDGTGKTFRWERFLQGGEAGAQDGDGFGNVDNLVIDRKENVWGVTDMSTSTHNGFDVGAAGNLKTINHSQSGNVSDFTGVFGNNWLFYSPTRGPNAGEVVPFAYGPPRSEMTGPTFVGNTLIVAVQHPGEDCPFTPKATLTRQIEMLALDGTLFNQTRSVARGSNWPSNIEGNPDGPPRPTVIGIRRKNGGAFV